MTHTALSHSFGIGPWIRKCFWFHKVHIPLGRERDKNGYAIKMGSFIRRPGLKECRAEVVLREGVWRGFLPFKAVLGVSQEG